MTRSGGTWADPPLACADVAQRFYVETLGCPKNQVDSEKLIGTLLADGMESHRRSCRRRSRGRQHLCVHRRGPTGVDRHDPGARGSTQGRRPPGRHRLHGRALRRRTGRGAPRGRPGRRVRRAGQPRPQAAGPHQRRRCPAAAARSAQPASAPVAGAVGLRQDRRGLRPQLRVLRHPVVPRPAAVARRRIDPRRGRAGRGEGDRARRPGPRVVRQGPPGRTRCRVDRAARAGGQRARRSDPAAVPLSVRPLRRVDRGDPRHRRALLRPVAAARLQAAAAAYAALGRR